MKLTREVKTGFFVVIIIASAVWGLNFLKGKNILSPTNNYYVIYEHIEGIIESGAVYYNGYQVGSINTITFDPTNPKEFLLKLILKKDLKIPLGTQVVAKETNLIAGSKDLQLIFTDTVGFHQPGDTLLPGYDAGIMGILDPLQDKFDDVIDNLNITLESVHSTLNKQMQSDLNASLSALRSTVEELSYSISQKGDLGKSLKNVESITGNLKNNNASINKTLKNLSNISSDLEAANLDQSLQKLDSTLASATQIMAKINNSEGSAGLLVNDSSLYINLASATANLDSLLVDLKENPKRYVHLSVFGKKEKNK
jgi:phospholipid/cholesterol/gamma-HCH transport system substrate-binding protein